MLLYFGKTGVKIVMFSKFFTIWTIFANTNKHLKMRTPSHVNPSCLCSCLLFILSAFTESRDDFRLPLDVDQSIYQFILASCVFNHSIGITLLLIFAWHEQNQQCMILSLMWPQDSLTYLKKVCPTHSYKLEKGLFITFLHIWERFVQHSRQTTSSWGWGRIWKLWGITNQKSELLE